MRQIRSEALRRALRELLDAIQHGSEHVTILRYDTPVAVIVPVRWYAEHGGEVNRDN
jgi:antitoxin (DNA-binding transcriptional repressor) of toxin-antitoxin stability system